MKGLAPGLTRLATQGVLRVASSVLSLSGGWFLIRLATLHEYLPGSYSLIF